MGTEPTSTRPAFDCPKRYIPKNTPDSTVTNNNSIIVKTSVTSTVNTVTAQRPRLATEETAGINNPLLPEDVDRLGLIFSVSQLLDLDFCRGYRFGLKQGGLDLKRREEYLHSHDFQRIFGMTKEKYASEVKPWKKLELKKKHGFF